MCWPIFFCPYKSAQQSTGSPSTPNLRLKIQISPCQIQALFLPLLPILVILRTMKRICLIAISELHFVTKKKARHRRNGRCGPKSVSGSPRIHSGHSLDDLKALKKHSEASVCRLCCLKYRRFLRDGPRTSPTTGLVDWLKIQKKQATKEFRIEALRRFVMRREIRTFHPFAV